VWNAAVLVREPPLGQAIGEWAPGVADRTAGAWIAILLYLLAAGLSWRARRRALLSGPPASPKEPAGSREIAVGWLIVGACMLFFGVTRLVDLGNLMTLVGRSTAHAQGWYGYRRLAQVAVILALGLLAAAALILILQRARDHPSSLRLAYGATLFVFCFVLVRACSWHYLDLVFGLEWKGLRVSWLLEWGSSGLVAALAARYRPSGTSPAPGVFGPRKVP
jgi:hypothetical protein